MDEDPELAVVSGKPWFRDPETGALVDEHCGDETAVGMTKFYRTACFRPCFTGESPHALIPALAHCIHHEPQHRQRVQWREWPRQWGLERPLEWRRQWL